ncbi:uncharacterized protein BXZ73DRAFT_86136 [Epithele typhae]|uniref:uncharacterized protein n=1 Tax=Epithele typhae TaxID=378194 RepID=UPI00200763D9|nr:uncharacterized protein BXZ73DRAFT_86136 [Epithele typhae]KAH9945890.1 hypothetical protein BXZ73DRAFT_86136 [Epithele typhae]
MHERSIPLAAKGKTKDSVHWQLGWWDLSHALEGTRRPVQHFPSSHQFVLPPPPLLLQVAFANNYEPATILSLCSTDDWLYAYFPGKSCPGIGCAWRKEAQLDKWELREFWEYPVGSGIVCAAWTSAHREWIVSDADIPSRLPPKGPLRLLRLTESHILHVYSLSPIGKPKEFRANLLQPTHPHSVGKLGGDKVCVKAAIGLCYQQPTILNSNQLFPNSGVMDLSIGMDISQPPTESSPYPEWDLWGEEQTISICEVRIEYRATLPVTVMTRPLTSIAHPGARLADLVFCCSPIPQSQPESRPNLTLVATYYDVGDYTSPPKVELASYTYQCVVQNSGWSLKSEHKRLCQTKVLIRNGLAVGFLDVGGLLPHKKSKSNEVTVGAIEILQIPDLSTHDMWESVPLHSHVQVGTVDVPVSVAFSPNETLICCISSPLLGSHLAVQNLPRRVSRDSALASSSQLHGDLSRHLVAAIRSRYSTSDVIHALAMPTLPPDATVDTLFQTLSSMERHSNGLPDMWIAELLGVAAEVYSARAKRLERSAEKDVCTARWQVSYEIASLSACCSAFETCRDGDIYDLGSGTGSCDCADAVWQLAGMTGVPEPTLPTSTASSATTLDSPIFLHLTHPYALAHLHSALEHVKRFHDQVAKLPAKGESSHIAKDVLMDTTGGSGIDIQLVGPLLYDILKDCKKLDAQDLRRSLASCCPVPSLKPHVRSAVDRIVTSKAIDRARLFVKPSDLADGLSRITVSERPAGPLKDKSMDVVRKGMSWRGVATVLCVRCGGRSDVGGMSPWQTWEKGWQMRCVCGGCHFATSRVEYGVVRLVLCILDIIYTD